MAIELAALGGSLPFDVPIKGYPGYAGYFTSRSFDFVTKRVPVCWQHWQEDDYVFANLASVIKGGEGLIVLHTLDLRMPQERAVFELAAAGGCYLSFGAEAGPAATRTQQANFDAAYSAGTLGSSPRPFSFGRQELGHVCYTRAAAIEQLPVQIIYQL